MKITGRVAMSTEKVIESVHILTASDRDCRVFSNCKIAIPAVAKQIDATGKAVVSGIVDVHIPSIDSNGVFPYSPNRVTA